MTPIRLANRRVSYPRALVLFLLSLCATAVLTAQSPAPPAPVTPSSEAPAAAKPPRRITLDLLVTDNSGKPVPGLEPFDFTLLDNNAKQKVLTFHRYESTPTQNDSPVEVIFVLDAVNASLQSMELERQDIVKHLRANGGKLEHPTTIVLLTDTDMKIEPHPSRDGNALAASLLANPNPVHSLPPTMGYALQMERQLYCLTALNKLAVYEASKPGRKMIIWVSHGWPSLANGDGLMQAEDLKRVFGSIVLMSRRLREARITLNSIDPRGPVQGENATYYQAYIKPVFIADRAKSPNLLLQVLATQSGGRVLDISTDLSAEIEMCVSDLAAWYSISYEPPIAAHADEYHSLEIKVSKPGLTVRTTSGYYDQPEVVAK
jgi:VWFA-related protein